MIEAERVDFVGVPVQDLKRADEFYGGTLGLRRSPHSSARWVEYETGNLTLALISPEAMGPKFQPQPHDRVLRAEQRRKGAFAETCRYVLNNPVRAGLVERSDAWKFSGAIVPGFPSLHPLQRDYWPKFWKLFAKARQPDAGNLVRPPFNLGGPQQEL